MEHHPPHHYPAHYPGGPPQSQGAYPLAPMGHALPAPASQYPSQLGAWGESRDENFELKRLLQAIQTRLWTVITIATLIFTAVAIYTFTQTKIYASTTTLLITPNTPVVAPWQGVADQMGGNFNEHLKTQRHIIRSERIARLALKRLNVDVIPGHEGELTSERRNISIFRGQLDVRLGRGTQLLNLRYFSEDPKFAARASNGAAQAYIEYLRARLLDMEAEAIRQLKERQELLKPVVEEARRRFIDYKLEHGLHDGKEGAKRDQLRQLNSSLAGLRTRLATYEARIESIEKNPSLLVGRDSTELSALRGRLIEAETTKAELLKVYTINHPNLRPIVERIRHLEQEIAREESRLLEEMRVERSSTAGEVQRIEALIAKLNTDLDEVSKKRTHLAELEDKALSLQKTYTGLLERVEQLEIKVATGRPESNVWVIDRAKPSSWPAKPRVTLQLLAGAVVGLLLGVGLALMLEFLNNTITSKEEVEQLGLGVIGFVPKVKRITKLRVDGKLLKLDAAQVAIYDSSSQIAEAFRSIRTGVEFVLPSDARRVMLVTSAMPNDGKSLVVTNLAISLARMGHRILVVDADLRKPAQSKTLRLDDRTGLSQLLTGPGDASLDELIRETPIENFHILTAGPSPSNPAELLASSRMGELVAELEERYDWIVFDAPPVGLVADAAALTVHVPNVAFVVRAFCTTRKRARMAVDVLRRTPAQHVFSIFNTVDIPGAYYYSGEYYYGYYYYGSREGREKIESPVRPSLPVDAGEAAMGPAVIDVEVAPEMPPSQAGPGAEADASGADGWVSLGNAAALMGLPRTAVIALAREQGWQSEVRIKPDGSDELFFRIDDLRAQLLRS